jgi:alpha-mannosidase
MGGHFHDLAAGTATPKSYEFAWNDDVIALNQFADVLTSATEAVSAALDTQTKGIPVVVFNPLGVAREDVVEAKVEFPGGMPKAVHVTAPDGRDVPAQISSGNILFAAQVPPVGYAVYDIQPGAAPATSSLRVSKDSLENQYYRVMVNSDGDVASIFDKSIGKELLSAPARLAISYDNPQQWPAWNMDWDQEQAPPKAYVGGPARIRVLEDGPVRVAVEVSRDTAGSLFVQTIRLSAGDAGRRVEFANAIDWNTRESNLKATFPLTASNRMATYNWDIGTTERPTAEPKKFEVPSHLWVDLTDMSGTYGATILTDCKNGSDKPTDNTIRLTLIRTPGTAGGYPDQGTQDIGHHEFVYGIAGHAGGWRQAGMDWQGQRLNDPLVAFVATRHPGALGRKFALLKIDNPRIRLMALKKAEEGNEVIVRMVELDGRPQPNVKIAFAAPIVSARAVNGQEQPVGPATVVGGELQTSFTAYQPRTFAVTLAPSPTRVVSVRSTPVELHYDLAGSTNDGTPSSGGFDGKGNALPAEMLPAQLAFNDVQFRLAPAKTGAPDVVVAKGQTIGLPAGHYNRAYVLAASVDGDQKSAFEVGDKTVDLNIQDWGGFIGQWDDREWSSKDTSHDNWGEMIGLKPGYIKRATLAWYCSHHHNAAGENVPYSYSYLFAYPIDLPAGARSIRLPDNDKVRILAVSVADENPEVEPAQPLYDVLPSPATGPKDFVLSASSAAVSAPQGMHATNSVMVMPRGGFNDSVNLTVAGVPVGVTATFSPAATRGASTLTLTADGATAPGSSTLTITGVSGGISHTVTSALTVTPVMTGTLPVDLSSSYNVTGIYEDGSKFAPAASLDAQGWALSKKVLGSEQVGDGVIFEMGPDGAPDVVTSATVPLPAGKFAALKILASGVEGSQEMQTFTVTYSDGTSSPFTQSLSDWYAPSHFSGESAAVTMPYRLVGDGTTDDRTGNIYAYSFTLDSDKEVRSVTLPGNRNVLVLAITLVPASK